MNKLTTIVLAVVAFIIFVFAGVASSVNGAISREEVASKAYSDIDVILTTRFNKLREMAECVKRYDEHEYRTLVDVISARGKNMSSTEAKECLLAFSRVEERYPQLQSQQNYQLLMIETSTIENRVGHMKNAYNSAVRDYNQYCRRFPTRFCLNVFGYERRVFDYYKADPSHADTAPLNLF